MIDISSSKKISKTSSVLVLPAAGLHPGCLTVGPGLQTLHARGSPPAGLDAGKRKMDVKTVLPQAKLPAPHNNLRWYV